VVTTFACDAPGSVSWSHNGALSTDDSKEELELVFTPSPAASLRDPLRFKASSIVDSSLFAARAVIRLTFRNSDGCVRILVVHPRSILPRSAFQKSAV
jgi:hypothetical protein